MVQIRQPTFQQNSKSSSHNAKKAPLYTVRSPIPVIWKFFLYQYNATQNEVNKVCFKQIATFHSAFSQYLLYTTPVPIYITVLHTRKKVSLWREEK